MICLGQSQGHREKALSLGLGVGRGFWVGLSGVWLGAFHSAMGSGAAVFFFVVVVFFGFWGLCGGVGGGRGGCGEGGGGAVGVGSETQFHPAFGRAQLIRRPHVGRKGRSQTHSRRV